MTETTTSRAPHLALPTAPAAPTGPALSVQGVSKRFGAVEALVEVSLDIHAGEVVALVGDNAAGKSTLAKVIAGVLPPDSGLIEIDGVPAQLSSPAAARQQGVASVFQNLGSATTSMSPRTCSSGRSAAGTGCSTCTRWTRWRARC